MTTNLLKEGALTKNSVGIGTVTRKLVLEHAVELTVIAVVPRRTCRNPIGNRPNRN